MNGRSRLRGTQVRLLAVTVLSCLTCTPADRSRFQERDDFARRFQEAGVNGTFVLYDPGDERYLAHNSRRARTGFVPASTFKILHSLIALETGTVADTSFGLKWDGVERQVRAWNRDHDLSSAFRNSVVWYYEELARRIGAERMHEYVGRARYGNGDTGGESPFWLNGNLRISPIGQVRFLERLHERALPFSGRAMDAVEGLLVEHKTPSYVLRGKTGWARQEPVDVGWYVGCVTRDGRPYYFALNMDVERPEQAPLRRRLALTILEDLGLLADG